MGISNVENEIGRKTGVEKTIKGLNISIQKEYKKEKYNSVKILLLSLALEILASARAKLPREFH